MKIYVTRLKGSHRNIRKRSKGFKQVLRNQSVLTYLMTHPEFTKDPVDKGRGVVAWRDETGIIIKPVVIKEVRPDRDTLWDDIDIWLSDSLYGHIRSPQTFTMELQMTDEGVKFLNSIFEEAKTGSER